MSSIRNEHHTYPPSSSEDRVDDTEIDSGPREECGVFGVWAPGEDVAKLTYYGLYALQHRGQEAAGIAVSDGRRTVVFKDLGLVSQVFDEQVLSSLHFHARHLGERRRGEKHQANSGDEPTGSGGNPDHHDVNPLESGPFLSGHADHFRLRNIQRPVRSSPRYPQNDNTVQSDARSRGCIGSAYYRQLRACSRRSVRMG